MTNAKFIILQGIQGSGKTTFAKQWASEDPEHRVRFNNDDIRNMLGNYWVPAREPVVENMKKAFFEFSMQNGYDIIVDNMNLNKKELARLENIVKIHNTAVENNWQEGPIYTIEYKFFDTPLEECILRDSKREHPIGEQVIKNTYSKYVDYYERIS